MIFQNLMIQWNPTFVLIDINKLFLLDNSLFLPIFRPHCSWSSKDHQTENLLWTCSSFHSQSRTGPHRAWMDHNDQCPARFLLRISQSARALRTLFMIDIVCVTTNCRVKDEWKRSWYKDNSVTKNLFRIYFFWTSAWLDISRERDRVRTRRNGGASWQKSRTSGFKLAQSYGLGDSPFVFTTRNRDSSFYNEAVDSLLVLSQS